MSAIASWWTSLSLGWQIFIVILAIVVVLTIVTKGKFLAAIGEGLGDLADGMDFGDGGGYD